MDTIQLVGCSKDSITFIIDLIRENYEVDDIRIFNNINDLTPINFSVKTYSVSIFDNRFFPALDYSVLFGVSGPLNKYSIYKHFEEKIGLKRAHYIALTSRTAYVAESSKLSNGVLVDAGVIISSQSTIEFGVTIKRGALIGHHNHIGEFCDINPGVVISGKVTIGKGCILGAGCVVTDNISIGDSTIIGIGSVVTKSIPSNVIAY